MPALRALLPIVAILILALGGAGAAADLKVVASIKPIHSLVAGVMEGVGTPTLLIEGAASPHSYTLRPSDARALARADVVFWIGEGLETLLGKPLTALARDALVVELADSPGLTLLAPRAGGAWAGHDEPGAAYSAEVGYEGGPDDGDDHGRAGYDGHLWLDPENAERLVARMAEALSSRDPAHAAAYRRNAEALAARLDALDAELTATLAPVKDVPYLVFHDAYQYFESRYGLAAVGSVTVAPDRAPGARRLTEIRARIVEAGVRCVFREPQFRPAAVETAVEGTPARVGEVDDLGATLAAGPELYFRLMRSLAGAMRDCLGTSG